jgi:Fe-Mn family superoxide dismutase
MSHLAKVTRAIAKRTSNATKTTTTSTLGLSLFEDPLTAKFSTAPPQTFSLPDMPYDYGALEPFISGEIMKIHHEKHHKAYVTNLNVALEKYADAERKRDLQQLITLQSAIKFNGGGHVNHSIFWTNLASPKNGGGGKPAGELLTTIEKDFGSFEKFVERMTNACVAVQGSGWGWLGYSKDTGRLAIAACPNQDPLLATHNLVPLLGFDVWEHAYYLQYKNVRPDYLKAIWNVVNWNNVADRLKDAKK